MRLGGGERRPQRFEPRRVGPVERHEETLRQAERQIAAHLLQALQRRGARLRHAAGVRCRRDIAAAEAGVVMRRRSEEHTSDLQSLMRISYAVFCLTKKNS